MPRVLRLLRERWRNVPHLGRRLLVRLPELLLLLLNELLLQ